MLSQDAHGVVFLALDRESGSEVVLRRFFPFGPGGGGLEGEERTAYMVALERLKGVVPSALRNILDGGCDPVDGMPYLVTEWIEGPRLSEHLKSQPLSPASVRVLLDQALEASQIMAAALGEEAVWVETAPEAVVLSEGEEGRGITFWISPLRWLGDAGARQGLLPLVELGEAALHWQGRVFGEQSGEGLGAWFKTIKAAPDRWTLEEARATLHAAQALASGPPSTPGRSNGGPPTLVMPRAPQKHKVAQPAASRLPWILCGILMLATTGLLAWKKLGGKASTTAPAPNAAPASVEEPLVFSLLPSPTESKASAAQKASARAAELQNSAKAATANLPFIDSKEVHAKLIDCGKQLRDHIDKEATITGVVYDARVSEDNRFRYIDFGSSKDLDAVTLRHEAVTGYKEMYVDQLHQLQGRQITVKGSVALDKDRRIVIEVAKREQITVLDP